MARGRFISKTLGSSQKFEALGRIGGKQLGEFSQLLYPLLVTNADDFGRLPGDSFTAKFRIFPTSRRSIEEFDKALDCMQQAGLVVRYSVNGSIFMQILNFDQHQIGLHKRTKSYFPEIPGNSQHPQELPAQQEQEVESEQELEQEVITTCAAPAKSADPPQDSGSDAVVMVFPTSGKPTTWPLLQSKLDEYRETYSDLDVVRECKQARQWCVDNEGNRKTANDMLRFLNHWLKRAQNEPGNKDDRFRGRIVTPVKSNGHRSRDPARSNNDMTCVCCKKSFVEAALGGFQRPCKCDPMSWCEEHMQCRVCCGCVAAIPPTGVTKGAASSGKLSGRIRSV